MLNNKFITMLQSVLCMVVVVLMLVFSLGQVFTLSLTDENVDAVEEIYEKLDVEVKVEKEIDVSFSSLLKSNAPSSIRPLTLPSEQMGVLMLEVEFTKSAYSLLPFLPPGSDAIYFVTSGFNVSASTLPTT